MRAFGESCMADYLREHPEIPTDQLRDKKGSSRLRNDNSASEDTLDSIKQRHKLTSADSEKSLRQGSNKFILWVIGSAVLLVVALVWMLLQSSTRRK